MNNKPLVIAFATLAFAGLTYEAVRPVPDMTPSVYIASSEAGTYQESSSSSARVLTGISYDYAKGLPYSSLTSGSVDPSCTLAQVKQSGYSATVRPPVSVTNPEKTKVMNLYGLTGKPLSDYEGDHLIPISLCGCPGPGHSCNFDLNFWPELWTGPNGAHAKDVIELRCLKAVRAGTIPLLQAQTELAQDWKTACR